MCKAGSNKGLFHKKIKQELQKTEKTNLALSMLLSAPTSTFHTRWDVKMSETKTAGQEGIVDAPREKQKVLFLFTGACSWWGRGADPDSALHCCATPHKQSSKIQRFGASEEQIQLFPCKYSHQNSFCSTRAAAHPAPAGIW